MKIKTIQNQSEQNQSEPIRTDQNHSEPHKEPLVTILTPCYNVEAYLPQCLGSIVNQTYKNLQIVLIDDGSKDNTWNILQDYASKDSRIEIYHQENQGVATTRNNLLDKVKGEYVLFVDSDDWMELDMLEYLYGCMVRTGTDIATCGNVINDEIPSKRYEVHKYSRDVAIREFLYHITFRGMLWNKLISSHLIEDAIFDKNISYGEDALFFWKILQKSKGVVFTTKELYHYRLNNNGLSLCSFGENKMTGNLVWKEICKDVNTKYPEYLDVACARACIESVLLLRSAASSNYNNSDNIKTLQNIVKKNYHCLFKVKITSPGAKIYAFIACRSFWLSSKIENFLR